MFLLIQGLRAAVFLLIQGLRTDLACYLISVLVALLHIDDIPVSYCMLLLEPGPESRGRCHPLRELLKFCSLGLVAFPIELLLVYCRNLGT